ncbi:RidA family protein [Deinococcus hohokamensis]|uniref:RidA family protein n=1 Tax=Deinococcus hohokamensis TaxID=309883 RepID=A0ABV9I9H9_9DEIO
MSDDTGRQNIAGSSPWEALVGYSRAVRVGQVVHVAGTTATLGGEVVGVGDPGQQTRVVLDIIAAALAEAGARLEDVVRTRIYVTDMAHWPEIGRAHGEVFRHIRPAASLVQVAALIDPRHLVEIEAEAMIL